MTGLASVTPIRPAASAAATDYLSPIQVCELVPGMTVSNLKDLRASGKGPAFFKPTGDAGKVTVYKRADVIAWVEQSRKSTTEQP